jgi:hypothetical protein
LIQLVLSYLLIVTTPCLCFSLSITMAPYLNETERTTSSNAQAPLFTVQSPNVTYSDDAIVSKYVYRQTKVATPKETAYDFKVERKVGKVGMMLVGWGGVYTLIMISDWTLAHRIQATTDLL